MDPAIDSIVAELVAAVQDLERHAQALQARAAELRASVERGRETRADLAERERIGADLSLERSRIDLEGLDETLRLLRACIHAERREIERVAQRQRLAPARENVQARPGIVRVRR